MTKSELSVLEKYLSDEEIHKIMKDECRAFCNDHIGKLANDKLTNDLDRIIANTAYYYIRDEIKLVTDESWKAKISEKVNDIIKLKNLEYEIFRRKSYGGEGDSMAIRLIDETVYNNKDLITAKTVEVLAKMSWREFSKEIKAAIVNFIMNKFGKM